MICIAKCKDGKNCMQLLRVFRNVLKSYDRCDQYESYEWYHWHNLLNMYASFSNCCACEGGTTDNIEKQQFEYMESIPGNIYGNDENRTLCEE